jgi:hypothetical protein
MEGQGVPPPATEGSATDSSAEQGLEAGRLPGRSDAGVPGNGSSSWSAAAARARRRGSPATETRADRHSRMIGRRRIRQREAFASTGAEVQLPPARPTRPRPWETRKPGRGQPRWTAAATPPRSQDGWRASENLRKDVGIAPQPCGRSISPMEQRSRFVPAQSPIREGGSIGKGTGAKGVAKGGQPSDLHLSRTDHSRTERASPRGVL